jgi:superfamily II DNA/RNA helicase
MNFRDYRISPGIKDSIAELGYKRPTDIQYKSIPPILKGEDVLAIAQTGTGKTAAFAIPVLHILHQRNFTNILPLLLSVYMVELIRNLRLSNLTKGWIFLLQPRGECLTL